MHLISFCADSQCNLQKILLRMNGPVHMYGTAWGGGNWVTFVR